MPVRSLQRAHEASRAGTELRTVLPTLFSRRGRLYKNSSDTFPGVVTFLTNLIGGDQTLLKAIKTEIFGLRSMRSPKLLSIEEDEANSPHRSNVSGGRRRVAG